MKTNAVSPSDQFVVVNSVRLHYLDWGGRGRALLFLPGFGDCAHIFDSLAPRFTHSFHALGLTRRGHVDSETTPGGYDVDTYVHDILGFLDAMSIPSVAIAGHSMAGAEMTHFAAAFPRRVWKLVYIDAAYDYSLFKIVREHDPLAALGPPSGFQDSAEAYLAYL